VIATHTTHTHTPHTNSAQHASPPHIDCFHGTHTHTSYATTSLACRLCFSARSLTRQWPSVGGSEDACYEQVVVTMRHNTQRIDHQALARKHKTLFFFTFTRLATRCFSRLASLTRANLGLKLTTCESPQLDVSAAVPRPGEMRSDISNSKHDS
jgi:hypothetical protein